MTITLITGANKGIGFETARQLLELGHVVYIGARDVERGEKAAAALGARFVQLDVTDDASVSSALATIDAAQGRLDVLVHNAGILGEGAIDGPKALRVFDTNAVGIVRVTEAALPLLRRSSNPNVVTVSSSAGSFWAVNNPDRPEFHLPWRFTPRPRQRPPCSRFSTPRPILASSSMRSSPAPPPPT